MSIFLSTFAAKIDKKGRVSVPSSFRTILAQKNLQSVVLFQSIQFKAIEGMGMDRMEKISQSIDRLDLFSQAYSDWSSSIFADAQHLSFDSEGRIVLPEEIKEYASIKDKVAFVGQGSTFQIWSPDLLKDHRRQAQQRMQKDPVSIGAICSSQNEKE